MEHSKSERLVLKQLELEHLEQFNELLKYVFQVTRSELEESGYEEGELMRAKRPILERADVFGWFNGDTLVSQISIYPCRVNIHGKVFEMGGLTGVGTYPEYSNRGLMKSLIIRALERMRERGQLLSFLFPYSIPYYREKGWEIISDHITFKLKDSQIPTYSGITGYVERESIDHVDVIDIYNKFALTNHGAMLRGELEWEEYWRWDDEEERFAAIYYSAEGEPLGFMFYWVSEDVFHIKEMVYLNQEARKGLWNFVGAHDSMIDNIGGETFKSEPLSFLIDDGHIEEQIEPYFMGRIVDVESFLTQYPFRDARGIEPFHFVVEDKMADWNRGIFGMEPDSRGELKVTRNAVGSAVVIDIQTLTTMLLSYRRPSYLHNVERLSTDDETLKTLSKIIPSNSPYFSDYF